MKSYRRERKRFLNDSVLLNESMCESELFSRRVRALSRKDSMTTDDFRIESQIGTQKRVGKQDSIAWALV